MNTNDFSDIDIQSLKIATFNVRGLKNSLKQEAIVKRFKDLKLNIIALQETHLIEQELGLLGKKWQGPIISSDGTNNSKGICILFDCCFDKDKINIIAKNDRFLLCECILGQSKFYVCNIYAPNDINPKINFFNSLKTDLKKHIKDLFLQMVVVLGDFNCVLNNKLDILSGNPHDIKTVKAFNLFINDCDLIDIWRLNNGNKKDYTWSGYTPLIARRLDYIVVSKFFFYLI